MKSLRDIWTPPNLRDRVVVVTGATRGVGRGIAEVLGNCGATVYAVARDTENNLGIVAEFANAAGGKGIAVRCDLRDDRQVEELFSRVEAECGRLDVLVNNAIGWGDRGPDLRAREVDPSSMMRVPLWQQPLWWWDGNFASGFRMHVASCRFAIPLMLNARRGGLVLFTSELAKADSLRVWDIVLDMRAHATARLVEVLAAQLRPHGISTAILYPGWTRTEQMVAATLAGAYPLAKSVEELNSKTVSAHFVGRAAAILAVHPRLSERSGTTMTARSLALEFGFTDIDGHVPDED